MKNEKADPDSAEVATLRLDVAWWRARVEAVERERDEARRYLLSDEERRKLTGDALHAEGLLAAAVSRAEAAEAAQAKLTGALRRIGDLWEGPLDSAAALRRAWEMARDALTSAASAPQAPPSDAAEEVK